jgi:hypothetical protein
MVATMKTDINNLVWAPIKGAVPGTGKVDWRKEVALSLEALLAVWQ